MAATQFALRRRLGDLKSVGAILLVPSLVCILVLLLVFVDEVPPALLLLWAGLQMLGVVVFVALVRRFDPEQASLDELRERWRAVVAAQIAASIGWMVIFPFLSPAAGPRDLALLGIIATAMYCGVLMVHRSSPRSAAFHIIGMSVAFSIAVWLAVGARGWPTFLLIAAFGAVLMVAIISQERNFRDAVASEIARQENADTVRMLLDDYEAQSSDSLWTIGPRGELRDVGENFAMALGKSAAELEGKAFLDLFLPSPERNELDAKLSERKPFRDLVLQLRVKEGLQYWRLSARPRQDGRMSGVARDVTADRLIEERVAFMAHYDNLTGLANRYLFNERLRTLTGRASSRGASIALFYLDLDDFKAINDTRGHLVGDRLLREVGTRLEQEVRKEDLVARLGGDEFAVIIETRAGDGLLIERAHRFLSVVRAPYEVEGHSYRISTSVGVARSAEGDCDAEELMRRADLALYAAKEQGRDKLALFEPALDIAAREQRRIETDLSDALCKGQMQMQYQPVIDLTTGATTGFEALLRWHHPERGILAPGDFLQVAEKTGAISSLGEWVIRQSLADVAAMPGNLRIAINLSPTQMKNPNLVATVAQAIHATNIAPERVELEITEHVLMEDQKGGHTTLMRLRELGIRVALDDFGTGYSSLGYLSRFPFDRIKIDRSFVTNLVSDLGSQAIVSTITRLADALGMDTTAEGIEDAGQLELLRKLGVQEAQGFLISRPVPPEELFDKKSDEGKVVLAADFEDRKSVV